MSMTCGPERMLALRGTSQQRFAAFGPSTANEIDLSWTTSDLIEIY
jgi:hypothetical protein